MGEGARQLPLLWSERSCGLRWGGLEGADAARAGSCVCTGACMEETVSLSVGWLGFLSNSNMVRFSGVPTLIFSATCTSRLGAHVWKFMRSAGLTYLPMVQLMAMRIPVRCPASWRISIQRSSPMPLVFVRPVHYAAGSIACACYTA